MDKKILILIIVLSAIAAIFLFPKPSGSTSGMDNFGMKCSCAGAQIHTSFFASKSGPFKAYCLGIPHDCMCSSEHATPNNTAKDFPCTLNDYLKYS